jgi:hypothetical protein
MVSLSVIELICNGSADELTFSIVINFIDLYPSDCLRQRWHAWRLHSRTEGLVQKHDG